MNYDKHLEPRVRERSAEEIAEIVMERWSESLRELSPERLLMMVPEKRREEVVDQMIDIILEDCDPKKTDPFFYKRLDMAEIAWEER